MKHLDNILYKIPVGIFILLSIKSLVIHPQINEILLACILGIAAGYFYKQDKSKEIKSMDDKIANFEKKLVSLNEDVDHVKKDLSSTKTDVTGIKMFRK